jgi:hypothetical protein
MDAANYTIVGKSVRWLLQSLFTALPFRVRVLHSALQRPVDMNFSPLSSHGLGLYRHSHQVAQ